MNRHTILRFMSLTAWWFCAAVSIFVHPVVQLMHTSGIHWRADEVWIQVSAFFILYCVDSWIRRSQP